MKNLKNYIGLAIGVASLSYFAIYVAAESERFPSVSLTPKAQLILLSSTVAYAVQLGLSALAWKAILSFYRMRIGVFQCLSVFYRSQFAKFVPGNIAQHISRIVLAKEIGIPARIAFLASLTEAIWVISCGLGIALVIIMLNPAFVGKLGLDYLDHKILLGFFLLTLAVPIFAPNFVISILERFRHIGAEERTYKYQINIPRALFCIVCYVVNFCFLGYLMHVIATVAFNLENSSFAAIVGISSIAWLAGFLTPGAPAGIGVRETIILVGLEPLFGPSQAAAIAIFHRLATALGDFLAYFIGLCISKYLTKSA